MCQSSKVKIPRFFFLVFVGFISSISSCFALPDDKLQPMHLSADSADLNQQTHQGRYMGNVTLDQGSTHLRANEALTQGNKDNKLSFAVAKGKSGEQAHYWSLPDVNKPEIHAFADEIDYYPNKHLIELIGNARVIQGDDSFSAYKITYDTIKEHVVTSSKNQQRTLIVFHPEKNNDAIISPKP